MRLIVLILTLLITASIVHYTTDQHQPDAGATKDHTHAPANRPAAAHFSSRPESVVPADKRADASNAAAIPPAPRRLPATNAIPVVTSATETSTTPANPAAGQSTSGAVGNLIPPPTPPVPPPTEANRTDSPVVPPGLNRPDAGP